MDNKFPARLEALRELTRLSSADYAKILGEKKQIEELNDFL